MYNARGAVSGKQRVAVAAARHTAAHIVHGMLSKDLRHRTQDAEHVLGEYSITEIPFFEGVRQRLCYAYELAVLTFGYGPTHRRRNSLRVIVIAPPCGCGSSDRTRLREGSSSAPLAHDCLGVEDATTTSDSSSRGLLQFARTGR
ncbi:MAG: hypothetical protein LC776_06735 [Acidobacteria bacterium]|nr:hypothetical protein [Acidobacteriota bacterium]